MIVDYSNKMSFFVIFDYSTKFKKTSRKPCPSLHCLLNVNNCLNQTLMFSCIHYFLDKYVIYKFFLTFQAFIDEDLFGILATKIKIILKMVSFCYFSINQFKAYRGCRRQSETRIGDPISNFQFYPFLQLEIM